MLFWFERHVVQLKKSRRWPAGARLAVLALPGCSAEDSAALYRSVEARRDMGPPVHERTSVRAAYLARHIREAADDPRYALSRTSPRTFAARARGNRMRATFD